jgi:hypothetical protein
MPVVIINKQSCALGKQGKASSDERNPNIVSSSQQHSPAEPIKSTGRFKEYMHAMAFVCLGASSLLLLAIRGHV